MKTMPRIDKFMTPMPMSINAKLPIKAAMAMMREFRIRHLPVQEGGQLVGVITERDVRLASSITKGEDSLVEQVMHSDPYSVSPQAPLNVVVQEMAEKKIGCAIVQQENGKVVGIFTANDGLRVFGEILSVQYKPLPEASLT